MKLIAAVSESWGIGKDNKLLYHIPEDMKFFKETTMDKHIIMGRNTFDSLPGPLYGRQNIIVVTSDPNFDPHMGDLPVTQMHGFDDMMQQLGNFAFKEDVFCIGGAMLYKSCLNYCDTAYITKIYDPNPVKADRFFPNLDIRPEWELEWYKPMKEYKNLRYQIMIYKNHNVKTYPN